MEIIKVEGNLIHLAQHGNFDAITHGCNCHCMMGAGIAPQMAEAFSCDKMVLETEPFVGDWNKLGQIEIHSNKEYRGLHLHHLRVINSYTQYNPGANLDYAALELCFKKLNHQLEGLVLGMPLIGCGIAGGKWARVERMIKKHMKNLEAVIVVEFNASVNSRIKLDLWQK